MSVASISLDSVDALRAFRAAMGLEVPQNRSIRIETSADPDSTTSPDLSAQAATQDGWLLNCFATENSQIDSDITQENSKSEFKA